jgi:hypothetical protein
MNTPQLVTVNLQSLKWTAALYVGGGGGVQPGVPRSSPYLWTVFFKIDGDTMKLTDQAKLDGQPTVVFTPGSHGNLGVGSVQVGDSISIPAAIGQWSTTLVPIPVDPLLESSLGKNLPGIIGFLTVLMNQNHVSDHGAEAGHQALNAAVQDAIAALVDTIGPTKSTITQEDIGEQIAKIPDVVKNAIINAQSFWENLWAASGPDGQIGNQVVTWSQPDLQPPNDNQSFKRQLGDASNAWDLDGSVEATDICSLISLRIIPWRRGATHCTNGIIVAGLTCGLRAQVDAPVAAPGHAFHFDWSVKDGDIVMGQSDHDVVVTVHNGVSQITASLTATDDFGCSVTATETFPVVTPEAVAQWDRICALMDELRSIRLRTPAALLHPAGPDPGPDQAIARLNHLAKRLIAATHPLLRR